MRTIHHGRSRMRTLLPLDAFLDAEGLCRLVADLRPKLEGAEMAQLNGNGGAAMGLPPARACLGPDILFQQGSVYILFVIFQPEHLYSAEYSSK